MSESLVGSVYLVTGASSGYGLGFTRALVEAGAKVGMLARTQATLEKAAGEFDQSRVLPLVADVSDETALCAAAEKLHKHFGHIDGVVNNAGIARPGTTETFSVDELQSQLSINVTGTVLVSKVALPYLKASLNPRIVNVSSASAEHHDEMAHLSMYAASKAAVERLSRDQRREMQEHNIGVTILRPGAAPTDFADGWDFNKVIDGVKAWNKRCGGYMDTGMEVEHVARSLLFCLSMPRGVSVDLLEVRPNRLEEKVTLE